MRIRVRAGDPRPIYQQIVDEVKRAVALGVARPEDTLPSVRRLAAELRVNPNTVQQAYRELEREGVIYVRRGQGTFVSPGAERAVGAREAVAEELAARALWEADRHGLSLEELIAAIRRVALGSDRPLETGEEGAKQ